MTTQHDITADHAISILNRHLDGDRWTFRRLNSRACTWTDPRGLRIEVSEYVDILHRIKVSNRYGSVSFRLCSNGIGYLRDIATMVGECDNNLRDTLHALQIACDSMASARIERMLSRVSR